MGRTREPDCGRASTPPTPKIGPNGPFSMIALPVQPRNSPGCNLSSPVPWCKVNFWRENRLLANGELAQPCGLMAPGQILTALRRRRASRVGRCRRPCLVADWAILPQKWPPPLPESGGDIHQIPGVNFLDRFKTRKNTCRLKYEA